MVLKNISEKRRILKKVLLFIVCIIISLSFVSCSNNTSSENKTSLQDDNKIISEQKTDTITEKATESIENAEKNIENLYVNYNGFKVNVNIDENGITELLDAEKNAVVPDVEMKISFADIIAAYSDNTEEVFATVCVGEDDCYYLKFANSKVKGAAFKMSDSTFIDELF